MRIIVLALVQLPYSLSTEPNARHQARRASADGLCPARVPAPADACMPLLERVMPTCRRELPGPGHRHPPTSATQAAIHCPPLGFPFTEAPVHILLAEGMADRIPWPPNSSTQPTTRTSQRSPRQLPKQRPGRQLPTQAPESLAPQASLHLPQL